MQCNWCNFEGISSDCSPFFCQLKSIWWNIAKLSCVPRIHQSISQFLLLNSLISPRCSNTSWGCYCGPRILITYKSYETIAPIRFSGNRDVGNDCLIEMSGDSGHVLFCKFSFSLPDFLSQLTVTLMILGYLQLEFFAHFRSASRMLHTFSTLADNLLTFTWHENQETNFLIETT